jgi:3-hydroxyisobutyrate dehydrogenase-like beta-hydroxyacid dehydrogenase
MNTPGKTIGILYLGEMGASVASVLIDCGLRAVTTITGRSEATARRASSCGCVVLNSFADVVAESDVLISIVPPSAAEEVVESYCAHAHRAPAGAVYVDLNSISPELATTLSERIAATGRAFVDGAINGLARNLTTSGTLFLSGSRAAEVGILFGDRVRVRLLGDECGRASAMKMLLSGLSKGVCALFAETALIAHRRGMLDEMVVAYEQIYPGMMTLIQRMFPTYSQHAERRAAEMRELEETARASNIEPYTLKGARELHDQLASVPFDASRASTLQSLIEYLANEGCLDSLAAVGVADGSSVNEAKVV